MILPVFRQPEEAGVAADVSTRMRAAFDRCAAALDCAGSADVSNIFVPGRIEVLGKHTDYAGGRSLLCAVEQGFTLVARPRRDALVVIHALDSRDTFTAALDADVEPVQGSWTNYPATVVRRVSRNFPGARTGADIAFSSNLPSAAGMSSSSALMIGMFVALATVNRLHEADEYRTAIDSRLALAAYAASMENGCTFRTLAGDRGVGTFGGSEDHTAILSCRQGRLACYAFAPARFEDDVAIPDDLTFVVAVSGVEAQKTGSAMERYNRASRLAGDVLARWNAETGQQYPTLEFAVQSSATARADLLAWLERQATSPETQALANRARQFCAESLDFVPGAVQALAGGDLKRFGELADASQRAAEEWLGNQVPETAGLARLATQCGAVAASAFGAGFGGSVWALVPRTDAPAFVERLRAAYRQAYPAAAKRASFLTTRPGPAAFAIP